MERKGRTWMRPFQVTKYPIAWQNLSFVWKIKVIQVYQHGVEHVIRVSRIAATLLFLYLIWIHPLMKMWFLNEMKNTLYFIHFNFILTSKERRALKRARKRIFKRQTFASKVSEWWPHPIKKQIITELFIEKNGAPFIFWVTIGNVSIWGGIKTGYDTERFLERATSALYIGERS